MALGMIPYVYSILITKETKPNRASWAIWAVIGLINLVAYLAAGEKETVWFVILAGINPSIIFALSFKYGEKRWYKSDSYCLSLAALAILLWKVTGNPVLALVCGLTADALGLIPTLGKINRMPNSENVTGWLMLLIASVLNIAAVDRWTWANGAYTIYSVVGSTLVVGLIVLGRYEHRHLRLPKSTLRGNLSS